MDKTPTGRQYAVFFTSGRSGVYEAIDDIPVQWFKQTQWPWRVYKLDFVFSGSGTSANRERKGVAYLNFSLIEEIKEH